MYACTILNIQKCVLGLINDDTPNNFLLKRHLLVGTDNKIIFISCVYIFCLF